MLEQSYHDTQMCQIKHFFLKFSHVGATSYFKLFFLSNSRVKAVVVILSPFYEESEKVLCTSSLYIEVCKLSHKNGAGTNFIVSLCIPFIFFVLNNLLNLNST